MGNFENRKRGNLLCPLKKYQNLGERKNIGKGESPVPPVRKWKIKQNSGKGEKDKMGNHIVPLQEREAILEHRKKGHGEKGKQGKGEINVSPPEN